jgi:hypothetical protein
MSHHGREGESDYEELSRHYSSLHTDLHKAREAIVRYLNGEWEVESLRYFAVENGIIPDPDKEIKDAQAEIEKCDKALLAAKKRLQKAMSTRKCKSDE